MRLTESAERYCAQHNVARTLVFSANRFARLVAEKPLKEISRDDLEQFAEKARRSGLSASTIKGTLKDLRTLAIDAGLTWDVPRVRVPAPEPEPTPHDHIDAIWPHLAPWSKQSVALMFWTCFRLADILSLQIEGISADAKVIRHQASKTSRNHAVPVPVWLVQWLGFVRLPFVASNDHAQVIMRGELDRVSSLAKVPQVYPRNLRQAGLTAWSRANGMAGAIIHGSGLSGVMQHYVSSIAVLESAAPRVIVPAAMRGRIQQADEDSLLANFRRLDQQAQSLITSMSDRLAAG